MPGTERTREIRFTPTDRPVASLFWIAVPHEHRGPFTDAWARRGVLCHIWPGFRAKDAERRFACELHGAVRVSQFVELFACYDYARYRLIRKLREIRGRSMTPYWLKDAARLAYNATAIRNRIVEANIPLVKKLARSVRLPVHDAIQTGSIAMIRCVENFDALRGYTFSTYAHRGVRLEMWKAQKKAERDVEPSVGDDYRGAIDERLGFDFDVTRALDMIERLPDQQRVALDMRLGLSSSTPGTLGDVGSALRVTTERARQVINEAVAGLRTLLHVTVNGQEIDNVSGAGESAAGGCDERRGSRERAADEPARPDVAAAESGRDPVRPPGHDRVGPAARSGRAKRRKSSAAG